LNRAHSGKYRHAADLMASREEDAKKAQGNRIEKSKELDNAIQLARTGDLSDKDVRRNIEAAAGNQREIMNSELMAADAAMLAGNKRQAAWHRAQATQAAANLHQLGYMGDGDLAEMRQTNRKAIQDGANQAALIGDRPGSLAMNQLAMANAEAQIREGNEIVARNATLIQGRGKEVLAAANISDISVDENGKAVYSERKQQEIKARNDQANGLEQSYMQEFAERTKSPRPNSLQEWDAQLQAMTNQISKDTNMTQAQKEIAIGDVTRERAAYDKAMGAITQANRADSANLQSANRLLNEDPEFMAASRQVEQGRSLAYQGTQEMSRLAPTTNAGSMNALEDLSSPNRTRTGADRAEVSQHATAVVAAIEREAKTYQDAKDSGMSGNDLKAIESRINVLISSAQESASNLKKSDNSDDQFIGGALQAAVNSARVEHLKQDVQGPVMSTFVQEMSPMSGSGMESRAVGANIGSNADFAVLMTAANEETMRARPLFVASQQAGMDAVVSGAGSMSLSLKKQTPTPKEMDMVLEEEEEAVDDSAARERRPS
jgi:hypothetical protein